jgi:hypothetical protein
MTLRITGFLDFVHHPEFEILENMFQKLDLRMETDPVSKMLCFVIFRILVDRAKSRDPVIF